MKLYDLFSLQFTFKTGAEDLRVKMEMDYAAQPTSNSAPPTPTPMVSFTGDKIDESSIPGGLSSIAPADMLNVWNASKMNSKSVNTADGNIKLLILFFYYATFKMQLPHVNRRKIKLDKYEIRIRPPYQN